MEDRAELSSGSIPLTLGRYELLGKLGEGGMATVYLSRHAGEAGFQRLYALKVLHPHLAAQEDVFVEMLFDEARIAARLHHPNVVPIVDLGSQGAFHYVAMEYVEGFALSALLRKNRDERPPRLIIPIVLDALAGLHAAHTLTDDDGAPMHLVHRDVSPQNVLVGTDGIARVIDFGIAKAESRINSTRPGELKGKLAFMSPEQIREPDTVDFRSDIFSAGVLLWSALTGQQIFGSSNSGATLNNILRMEIERPSKVGLRPPAVFDTICMRALERDRNLRIGSMLEMEESLRSLAMAHGLLGSKREVAEWVQANFADELHQRRALIRAGVERARMSRAWASGTMPLVSERRSRWQEPALALGAETSEPEIQLAAALEPTMVGQPPAKAAFGGRTKSFVSENQRWLWPAAAVACGVLAALALRSWEHGPNPREPPPKPSATARELSPTTSSALARATVAASLPPSNVASATPLTSAAAVGSSAAKVPAGSPLSAARARPNRPRFDAAPPKPVVRAPDPPAPAPAPEQHKKAAAWDSDSSIPPP